MSEPLLRDPAGYRPWKPAALADVTPLGAARPGTAAAAGKAAQARSQAAQGEVNIPSPEAQAEAARLEQRKLLEAERQRARVEGYNAGYNAGREAGAQAARDAADRLLMTAANAQQSWHDLEQDLSEQVLDLALEVARQVLRHDYQARRDALIEVVQEAMQCVSEGALKPEMRLHPADVELVRGAIGDELQRGNWKLAEDHRIEPGGCRITTTQGEVDATLPTRWRRVIAALGRDTSWTADHE
jgi:flagellar assembly protein FliH